MRCTILILFVIIGCCNHPAVKSEQSMKIKKEQGYSYFRSFDKFNLRGIDELNEDTIAYPFVMVSENEGRNSIRIKVCIDEETEFEDAYLKERNIYLKKNLEFFKDEPLPFWQYYTFVLEGKEIRFLYLYAKHPDANMEKPVLAEIYEASPVSKQIYEFPIYDTDSPDQYNRKLNIKPDPSINLTTLKDHVAGIRSLSYTIKNDRLIVDEIYYDFEIEEDEETIFRTKLIYRLDKYPPFFVDYISPLMLEERIEIED